MRRRFSHLFCGGQDWKVKSTSRGLPFVEVRGCSVGVERSARQSPGPCPTAMTGIAMFAHRVANNFTSWNRWLKLQRFGWKPSHVDFNKAALHALKLAHYGVRRHLCRKQIRNHVEKQSQLEPRWKIVQRSLLAEVSAVDAWFISSPPMKAIKKPMMKHAMKVLFWKFELHI